MILNFIIIVGLGGAAAEGLSKSCKSVFGESIDCDAADIETKFFKYCCYDENKSW